MTSPYQCGVEPLCDCGHLGALHDGGGRCEDDDSYGTRCTCPSYECSEPHGCTICDQQGDPRMSKPNRKRFKLSEIRQQAAETTGDVFEIETDDGQLFEVPAPGFWEDDIKALFAANRDVDGVKALLGPREYLKFRAAGGRADDVALALRAFAKEQGVEVGESSASPIS
jgi:hypothetical protein